MSRPLDTAKVTRAMLATSAKWRPWTEAETALLRKHYHRGTAWLSKRLGRGARSILSRAQRVGISHKWTRHELTTLRLEWGELSERGLMRKLPGRTWGAIAIRAHRMGLANPNQGKVDMREASRITGIDHRTLPAVLAAEGVRRSYRVRVNSDRCITGHRQWVVDADEARDAAARHFNKLAGTLSRRQAAERLGVSHPTMLHLMRRLAATRPVEGMRSKPWRLLPADVDAAAALRGAARGES